MAITQRNSSARASLLSIPSAVERIERLRPPRHLSDEQAEVWRAIVEGHPADWFDTGGVPLLTQLCRHVVISNRIAELVERADGEYELFNLLKEQRSESATIAQLSRNLRISPQSMTNHRGNKKAVGGAFRTPWTRHLNDAC